MADLATLGIIVDSSSVKTAVGDLDRLPQSAQRAETAVSGSARKISNNLKEVSTSTKQAANDMRVLGAQFTDIGVSLATGQSPFYVLLQQGGQIRDLLGDRGAKGAVSALGMAFKEFATNPLTLATLGIAGLTAGIQYLVSNGSTSVERLDEMFKRHAETVKDLKTAYGDVAKGVKEVADPTRVASKSAFYSSQADLKKTLIEQASAARASFFSKATDVTGEDIYAVNPAYQTISKALADFKQSVEQNKPDFKSLLEAVDSLYNQHPGDSALKKLRDDVHALGDAGAATQARIRALTDELEALERFNKRAGGAFDALGGLPGVGQQIEALKPGNTYARSSEIGAMSPREAAVARENDAYAEQLRLLNRIAGADRDTQRKAVDASHARNLQTIDRQFDQKENRGFDRALDRGQDRLRDMQAEIATFGQSRGAVAAYRLEVDLLAQAKEKGATVSADEETQLKRLAALYGQSVDSLQSLRRAQDVFNETKLLGFSPEERSIRSRFDTDDQGNFKSAWDERTAAAMRYNKAVQDAQEAERGLGAELLASAKKGDWKGALSAISGRIEGYITKQAGDQLDNAIQGMIPGLFGKAPMGAADVKAMTTAAMNVTANVVSINGAVGASGLAGAGGALANPAALARSPVAKLLAPTNDNTPAANAAPYASEAFKSLGTGGGSLSFVGNYKRGVDPRLTSILGEASKRTGYDVQAFSGFRPGDPRFHGQGMATDIRLMDPKTGQALPSYQSAANFRAYEQYAQTAREVQMERYPGLEKDFRWGGYFSGPQGKYGAVDLMHFDLGGRRVGMGGGSWEGGMTAAQRRLWPGANSQGMGELLPTIPVDNTAKALTTLNTSATQLNTTAQAATQGIGGLGQSANGVGGLLSNLIQGIGAIPAPGAAAGGGGGILGGLLSGIGSLFGFADGGSFRVGGAGGTDSQLVAFRATPNETVSIRRPDQMAGGGSGGVSLKYETHYHGAPSNMRTKDSEDGQGNRRTDVWFDDAMAQKISKPGSASNRAVQGFGVSNPTRRYG